VQVLSGAFDAVVRVHGLKSGKMLKEFRGHTSYVNDATYSADGSTVISASSDATVRVWDAKSCECLHAFRWAPFAAVAARGYRREVRGCSADASVPQGVS
jgi:WD40 repeat-containing protein SMU1